MITNIILSFFIIFNFLLSNSYADSGRTFNNNEDILWNIEDIVDDYKNFDSLNNDSSPNKKDMEEDILDYLSFKTGSLEHIRDSLIDIMSNYMDFSNLNSLKFEELNEKLLEYVGDFNV